MPSSSTLYGSHCIISFYIRHVVVPGITYSEEQLSALGRFLRGKACVESVELLSYHSMGIEKYKRLGLSYPLTRTEPLTDAQLQHAREIVDMARKGTE